MKEKKLNPKENIQKSQETVIEELSKKTGVSSKDVSMVLNELGFERVVRSVSDYAPDKISAENLKVGIRISQGGVDV